MRKRPIMMILIPAYIAVFAGMLFTTTMYDNAADAIAENTPLTKRHRVVIDAGHGGMDGGATSCSGVLESKLNLDIAFRLNDLFHLLGIDTVMIRNGDYSVYTQGATIAQQKVSDLKQRVQISNTTKNAFVISIHQNYFPDSRYYGPQIFYAKTEGSLTVAGKLQNTLNLTLAKGCKRKEKQANGIYLMEHLTCDGILVECGFLSNPAEEGKLLSANYQKQICSVIACVIANHFNSQQLS